jgi:hypothetical protein
MSRSAIRSLAVHNDVKVHERSLSTSFRRQMFIHRGDD